MAKEERYGTNERLLGNALCYKSVTDELEMIVLGKIKF